MSDAQHKAKGGGVMPPAKQGIGKVGSKIPSKAGRRSNVYSRAGRQSDSLSGVVD